jgi:hypothetical protein
MKRNRKNDPDFHGHVFMRFIEQALSPEQLAGIGKVAVLWADCDELLNISLHRGLRLPTGISRAVISTLSTHKKTNLINSSAEDLLLSQAARDIIADTMSAVGELGDLRDAIVHAAVNVFDTENGVGTLIARSGKKYDVLRNRESLDGVANRLDILRDEIAEIAHIFISVNYSFSVDGDTAKTSEHKGPVSKQVAPLLSNLAGHQARRKSLPPLPKFPV